jgi:hypothetical protein
LNIVVLPHLHIFFINIAKVGRQHIHPLSLQ